MNRHTYFMGRVIIFIFVKTNCGIFLFKQSSPEFASNFRPVHSLRIFKTMTYNIKTYVEFQNREKESRKQEKLTKHCRLQN